MYTECKLEQDAATHSSATIFVLACSLVWEDCWSPSVTYLEVSIRHQSTWLAWHHHGSALV